MPTSKAETGHATRPYSIELVPVDRGWILEKIAGEIDREAANDARFRVTVTAHPSGKAELTFFLPESAWRDELRETIRVTYLAHKEDHPGAAALFEEVARKSDHCVTSSSKYAQILREDGARAVTVIPLGVDTERFVPKVRIGVIGRTYHTGRKGEALLARSLDLPYVEFVFTGEGWPLPAHHYGERELVELFQSLDYLLVPSLIEGGPVPMLEALASGCPVIAPTDIGMVADFPHIPFRRGDAEDLRRVIEAEVAKRVELRAAALPCDWRRFARRHLELFANLIAARRAGAFRTPSARSVEAHAATERCRVLLLTHGAEGAAKGGPTTRVRNIVAHLGEHGLGVEMADGPGAIVPGRYDIVHVFNSWPPDSALAALTAARRAGARVVFSPIALDLADWPLFHPFMEKLFESAPDMSSLLKTLSQIREATPPRRYAGERPDVPVEGIPGLFEKLRQCCDIAHRLVFLSEYERAYLAAIGARTDHGVLVRNGVDAERMLGADPERFRREYGLDRYVLSVGRLEYRKNQALAALAMRDTSATLVLVGGAGDGGYLKHLRHLGRDVRLIDRIEDRDLLASAYAGAEAFLFPSWTEGAPLAAMEAAAAGTPLVLGGMSGEREYFGDDAVYVHPADVDAARAAVERLLAQAESPDERAARGARCAARFSVARHADETWSLYQRVLAQAEVKASSAPIVADVSALLHFVRVRQPFTGVPLVESNLLRELHRKSPALQCIVYNDVKDRFIEVGIDDIENFDEARFSQRYWFSRDEPSRIDRCATLRFADGKTASPPIALSTSSRRSRSARREAVLAAKLLLQRMPRIAREPAVAMIRRARPNFDPYALPPPAPEPQSQGSVGVATRACEESSLAEASDDTGAIRFAHPLATLRERDVPRQAPVVPVGARLLTLGQSWLSNGPLLDAMLGLARTRVLSLEPYVYDLTYHTGAHLSGWEDNSERFARLLALLSASRRVYTESRQVEKELQKLRATRGFSYSTRRTGLRGRDPAGTASTGGGPAYAPNSFVLVVSSFNKRKNHDFLVGVWRNLFETWLRPQGRTFRLVLVGQVQEERKYAEPAFVAELARWNIDVRADLADAVLARLMRDCAFTAYPSLQEGWGLPAQESLMCGKVCLVSDTLPVAEEIRNAALIRIAPNDFYGWHEALRTWLENEPMRRAFAARAKEYVPPSWNAIAAAIAAPD